MKIGDRVFVRGYIDEIRKDTVIIRNAGGYFGTIPSEVITGELPSAEKPFNLPEIYIAEGYDTIEGEDGNVGFGVYVPDETKIYVAGDVEGEIRARALFHEVCHWVQAMCGRPFDEDEANEFSDIVYDALPSAQPEPHYDEWCTDCKEYDKERHCCPRWNRVIRRALKDAQPERKTGRWIYGEDNPGTGRDGWFCSECEHFEMWDYSADMKSAELNLPNFCPNCGARMKEEDV